MVGYKRSITRINTAGLRGVQSVVKRLKMSYTAKKISTPIRGVAKNIASLMNMSGTRRCHEKTK